MLITNKFYFYIRTIFLSLSNKVARSETRTHDQRFFKPLLYQLSYSSNNIRWLVGIEPTLIEPQPIVLPLNYNQKWEGWDSNPRCLATIVLQTTALNRSATLSFLRYLEQTGIEPASHCMQNRYPTIERPPTNIHGSCRTWTYIIGLEGHCSSN